MESQPTENDFFGSNSSSNLLHSLESAEEINSRTRYDFNYSEAFYEIDVAGWDMTLYPDEEFKKLLQDIQAIGQANETADRETTDVVDELLVVFEAEYSSAESNEMANKIQSTDEQLAMIKSNKSTLPVIHSPDEKLPSKLFNEQSILLSESVAVTVPAPKKLQLTYPLEDSYRARYKSDYFPQKGDPRHPRYVADSKGNHFITLQMPTEYHWNETSTYLRVALITTSIGNRGHFYSPYKFQTDNNDCKVPDCNPIYLSVQSLRKKTFDLKLQLVLIKLKLDQLNEAQPLKSFCDVMGSINNILPEKRLPPKDLISNYQLDKSHIAFTLCTKQSDGTYDIQPETTVISSMITELMTKQKPETKKKSGQTTSKTIGKQVCCPKCAHSFDPLESQSPKTVNKRKANLVALQTPLESSTGCVTSKKKKTA